MAPAEAGTARVEPARPGDLAQIMILERAGFTGRLWSPTAWAEEIGRLGHIVLVGRDATGQPVGAAAWSAVAETAELLRLVVDPARRRQGWGRRLVEAGLEWAAQTGAEVVFLEVAEDNQAASQLYLGLGFSVIDRRRDYYNPGQPAIVMRRAVLGDGHV
jgi:ribosomal-protein-alanine N-acetyltransferase